MQYLLWRSAWEKGYCSVDPPEVDRSWELSYGISRAKDFPKGLEIHMPPRRPKDIKFKDNLYGGVNKHPVVSGKLKEILQKEIRQNKVEYIPAKIINQKKRTVSKDYFLINPLDIVDCIDITKPGIEWNTIKKDLIDYCEHGLMLKPEAIPKGFNFFRPRYWEYNILVSEELAEKLKATGLTGLVFRSCQEYKGLG